MMTKEQLVGFLTVVKGSLEAQLADPISMDSIDSVLDGMRDLVLKKVKIMACASVLDKINELPTAAAMVAAIHKNLIMALDALTVDNDTDTQDQALLCDLMYPMVLEVLGDLGDTISQLQDVPTLETPVDPAE